MIGTGFGWCCRPIVCCCRPIWCGGCRYGFVGGGFGAGAFAAGAGLGLLWGFI